MKYRITDAHLHKLIAFRKQLHAKPELSGQEYETQKMIREFLSEYPADEVIEIGKTGLAFIYNSGKPGKTLMLRADIDALPLKEINVIPHKSTYPGRGHLCGHDGHTTMLAGLAHFLLKKDFYTGRVILLFQPSEENGAGALMVLNDPQFKRLKPDKIFGLHNLPTYEKGAIVIRKGSFASASTGMIIRLTGKTSHAAFPESGLSPVLGMTGIIDDLMELNKDKDQYKEFTLLTIIHSRLGEIAFGTNPGYAEVMATLRSYRNDDMKILKENAVTIVRKTATKHRLANKIEWTEHFAATSNDDQEAVDMVIASAEENHYKLLRLESAFRWSEDFGFYLKDIPGAFFGIGIGEDHADLHNPDYDFEDKIIPAGMNMFLGIIERWH